MEVRSVSLNDSLAHLADSLFPVDTSLPVGSRLNLEFSNRAECARSSFEELSEAACSYANDLKRRFERLNEAGAKQLLGARVDWLRMPSNRFALFHGGGEWIDEAGIAHHLTKGIYLNSVTANVELAANPFRYFQMLPFVVGHECGHAVASSINYPQFPGIRDYFRGRSTRLEQSVLMEEIHADSRAVRGMFQIDFVLPAPENICRNGMPLMSVLAFSGFQLQNLRANLPTADDAWLLFDAARIYALCNYAVSSTPGGLPGELTANYGALYRELVQILEGRVAWRELERLNGEFLGEFKRFEVR